MGLQHQAGASVEHRHDTAVPAARQPLAVLGEEEAEQPLLERVLSFHRAAQRVEHGDRAKEVDDR